MTAMNDSEGATRVHDDERGAVLVIGLFLALAVIAALWCVIGIGDALIMRERTQEAADSVAFTNAVIHARGMNFIALINIVLMGLCMVYVVVTALDFLLSIVLAITGVRDWFPYCATRYVSWLADIDIDYCDIAGAVQKIEIPIYKFDKKFFELYKRVSKPMFETQVWAATIVPGLGTLASLETGNEYQRLGMSFSLSLVPGGGARPPLNALQQLFDRVPKIKMQIPGKKPGETANLFQDRRIGLPVEAEPAYAFCIRGARFALQGIQDQFRGLVIGGHTAQTWTSQEPWSTLLYGVFQSAGEATRVFFCGEKDGQLPEDPAERAKFTVLIANREAVRWAIYWGMGPALVKDDTQSKFYLQGDSFWRMNWPNPAVDNGYFAGPKRLSSYAYNGNDWMQVWGVAFPESRPDRAASIVSLPSRLFGRTPAAAPITAANPTPTPVPMPTPGPTVAPSPGSMPTPNPMPGPAPTPPNPNQPAGEDTSSPVFWSQAEFYFDCTSVWQSSLCNKGSAALYQLRWRARLRRIHDFNIFGDLFEMFLDNALFGTIAKSGAKVFLENKGISNEWIREGIIKAVRNDLAKIINHRVFTGDRSSQEMLH